MEEDTLEEDIECPDARNPKEAEAPLGFSNAPFSLSTAGCAAPQAEPGHGPEPTPAPCVPFGRGRPAGFRLFHPKVSPQGGPVSGPDRLSPAPPPVSLWRPHPGCPFCAERIMAMIARLVQARMLVGFRARQGFSRTGSEQSTIHGHGRQIAVFNGQLPVHH
jgi:hypothetical protein